MDEEAIPLGQETGIDFFSIQWYEAEPEFKPVFVL